MNKNKYDMAAKLFIVLLHLKEEQNKKYSSVECEKNYNKYKEVLTKIVFDEKDEIKIEKLSEFYSVLSVMD